MRGTQYLGTQPRTDSPTLADHFVDDRANHGN
jgi:hypothetical protein